jgi:hypothetical protein
MRVEKRQKLGRPGVFPDGDAKPRCAGHTAIEPTQGETQTQVGRSLNALERRIGDRNG